MSPVSVRTVAIVCALVGIATTSIVHLMPADGPRDGRLKTEEIQIRSQVEDAFRATASAASNIRSSLSSSALPLAGRIRETATSLRRRSNASFTALEVLAAEATETSSLLFDIQRELRALKALHDASVASFLAIPDKTPAHYQAIADTHSLVLHRLNRLGTRASPRGFSGALEDVMNTLVEYRPASDLRTDDLTPEQFYEQTGARWRGVGTLLIGNPAFGRWSQAPGEPLADSTWQFSERYRGLLVGSGVRLGDWASTRPYTFYQDVVARHLLPETSLHRSILDNAELGASLPASRYATLFP